MEILKSIKNFFKMIFNPTLRTRYMRKKVGTAELFEKYDAKRIWIEATYDETVNTDDSIRMRDFLDYTVMKTIRSKSFRGEMDCTVDIPEDLFHLKDQIIDEIRSKGFQSDWLGEFRPYLNNVIVISWRDFSHCLNANCGKSKS